MRKSILVFLLTLFWSAQAYGHGLTVSNIRVGDRDSVNQHVEVLFDISWTNSWRFAPSEAPGNWDAAWVFIKYRRSGGEWQHARLNGDGAHFVPVGGSVRVGVVDTSVAFNVSSNPGVGVFLYRSTPGSGTFSLSDVRLSWYYGNTGITEGEVFDVKVFGVEMVYIPEGAFYAGDGTSTYSFRAGTSGTSPVQLTSESAVTIGDTNNGSYALPAEYPKGFGSFYMMKGEISQGQWVSFYNTLPGSPSVSGTPRHTRNITASKGNSLNTRNNVILSGSNATLPADGTGATYSSVAMNWFSWGDLVAYLDWSGLRPMSELEFEKAGRGPVYPVSGEYAWGSTSLTNVSGISNSGLPTEVSSNGANVNVSGSGTSGPLRVGAFGKGASTRVGSGASYFGVFDLSGNLWERCVTAGDSTGRSFVGSRHGNGGLSSSGDADVLSWPSQTAVGAGFRGGDWGNAASFARLADRGYAAGVGADRNNDGGGRGVRSGPAGGG